MARKVFIVSNGGHDYSAAEEFGELTFCTENLIRRDDVAQMYREVKAGLEDGDARPEDYILVSSLTSMCMVAAAIMADWYGELHLLVYHNGQYIARDLILDGARDG